MEDYFDDKVKKIKDLYTGHIVDPMLSIAELEKNIRVILKEVARDQRYACIEKINELSFDVHDKKSEHLVEHITQIIHNIDINEH